MGKQDATSRYEGLFSEMAKFEHRYSDIIDKDDLVKVKTNFDSIPEDGKTVDQMDVQTRINIFDAFRAEYLGDDGDSESAREGFAKMVLENNPEDNDKLKNIRNMMNETIKSCREDGYDANTFRTKFKKIESVIKAEGGKITDEEYGQFMRKIDEAVENVENNWTTIKNDMSKNFFGKEFKDLTPDQQAKIESTKSINVGYAVAGVFEAGIVPGLLYRFYKTGSFNLGASNYFDNNKAINKLSWASWDEISKISQRIVVELAAFWSGGELANLAIRGAAEIALVANTARRVGLVTEA
jgi:hypothetical protein